MSDASAPLLITSDLSPRSDRALARGVSLARHLGAPAVVFTSIDSALPEDMAADVAERATQRLTEQIAPLAGNDVDVTVETHVGDPCEDIIERVETLSPRLLVMGTHRRRAFLDALRETTMQRVVRRTDCAALLVADPAEGPYQKIIVATDFSPAAAVVLKTAQALSESNVEVSAVHALQIPFSGRIAKTPQLMAELEVSFSKDALGADATWRKMHDLTDIPETRITTSSIHAALDAETAGSNHCLIAIGAHGRVGANRAVLGSVAIDLMRDPPCDVLVARPSN